MRSKESKIIFSTGKNKWIKVKQIRTLYVGIIYEERLRELKAQLSCKN